MKEYKVIRKDISIYHVLIIKLIEWVKHEENKSVFIEKSYD